MDKLLTTQDQVHHLNERVLEIVKIRNRAMKLIAQNRQRVLELHSDITLGYYDDVVSDTVHAIKQSALAELDVYNRILGPQ